ncbi:MAG TPA: hypothetical protein VND96_06305 [Candidatus Micrarchaeaceae archaeon]|nr:hypothetical protein [Candidatus Micrarchaeaceae archaeon]
MVPYLLVAQETADSPELLCAVQRIADEDPEAEFVVLVPTTPVDPVATVLGEHRSARQLASSRAQRIRAQLRSAGVRFAVVRLGNYDPVQAIEDALRFTSYRGLVLVTPPAPLSRLLRIDLVSRMRHRHPGLIIRHAEAQPPVYLE